MLQRFSGPSHYKYVLLLLLLLLEFWNWASTEVEGLTFIKSLSKVVVLGETMSSTKFKPVKSLIFLVGPMSHARANPDLAWSADILLGGAATGAQRM